MSNRVSRLTSGSFFYETQQNATNLNISVFWGSVAT